MVKRLIHIKAWWLLQLFSSFTCLLLTIRQLKSSWRGNHWLGGKLERYSSIYTAIYIYIYILLLPPQYHHHHHQAAAGYIHFWNCFVYCSGWQMVRIGWLRLQCVSHSSNSLHSLYLVAFFLTGWTHMKF